MAVLIPNEGDRSEMKSLIEAIDEILERATTVENAVSALLNCASAHLVCDLIDTSRDGQHSDDRLVGLKEDTSKNLVELIDLHYVQALRMVKE